MIAVISAFILIIIWDFRSLLKDKDRVKTMMIYFILIGAGLTIGILLSIGKRPVGPAEMIEHILAVFGVGNEG